MMSNVVHEKHDDDLFSRWGFNLDLFIVHVKHIKIPLIFGPPQKKNQKYNKQTDIQMEIKEDYQVFFLFFADTREYFITK